MTIIYWAEANRPANGSGPIPAAIIMGRVRRGSHQSVICGAEMTQQRKLDLILGGKRRHTEDRGQERFRWSNAKDTVLRRRPMDKRIKAERQRKACKINVRQESLHPWPSVYINVPSQSKPHAATTLRSHKYFRARLLSPSISLCLPLNLLRGSWPVLEALGWTEGWEKKPGGARKNRKSHPGI